MNVSKEGTILRLDENVNWAPLTTTTNPNSRTGIRLRDAALTQTQSFPAAHGNSSYLRLTVMQDGSEHILMLPFEDERVADAFNTKLISMMGQTLEALGSIEI